MSISDMLLWKRIENFDIDEVEIDLPFSKRLARENSWPDEFALRVVEEYKKFIYLTCVSKEPVTPSDEVDQAWHLHLTYTQSYWDQLCDKVLERRLHHNPTKGGTQEFEKFEDWYENTKAFYEQEFDIPPPRDIWPASYDRFNRPPHMKRVDTSANLVIRKPLFLSFYKQPRVLALFAFFMLSSTSVLGIEVTNSSNLYKSLSGTAFFMILIGIYLGLINFSPVDDHDSTGCGGCGCGGCGGCGGC